MNKENIESKLAETYPIPTDTVELIETFLIKWRGQSDLLRDLLMKQDPTSNAVNLINMEEAASQIIDVLKNSMNRQFTDEDREKILNAILLSSTTKLIETNPLPRRKQLAFNSKTS